MSKCFFCSFVFLRICILNPRPVWTAEVRLGEGGGLHPEEAAPGLPAVLLRPQRSAVPQENSNA